MNIKRVGNVILAVKDLDKSVEFYHNILGLPIRNQRRTWVDLGQSGAAISLHPASLTAKHIGNSLENGIVIGFVVEREAGKNAIVLDPDEYMISLFEPSFADKDQQTTGYHGFTPA